MSLREELLAQEYEERKKPEGSYTLKTLTDKLSLKLAVNAAN